MGGSGKLIFGGNVRRLREALGMTQESVAEASGLDRSYVGGVERGERNPALSAILRLATALRVTPARLFEGIGENIQAPDRLDRLTAVEADDRLLIRFRYDQYDAEYHLLDATAQEFRDVIGVLGNGLATYAQRTDAVSDAFLRAVRVWPGANPSDIWTFLINRAYCDRSNHPEAHARLNLEQSWKRTSGWALERVLVSHYRKFLGQNRISIKIGNKSEKMALVGHIDDPRIVPDKADVLLSYDYDGEEQLLGVVHVKASIAERRTDDVPMSQALIAAGYLSVFWTMDAKSFPAARPVNLGEFGGAGDEQTSDKRRDFEEHGHFSACFSYNLNTEPTPGDRDVLARIFVCDFTNPSDRFSRFLIDDLRRRLPH